MHHYLQQVRHGSNPNVHQQTNGSERCGILLSHKKNEIMPFAITWMNLERIILSESDRESQVSYDVVCIRNLKKRHK